MRGSIHRKIRALDVLTAVAALVVALGAVQLVAGALSTGITIDEPIHVDRAASWLDTGWYVPESSLVDGRPDPDSDVASPYVYGPAYSALAHAVNVVAGNESLGEVSRTTAAYAVRHLVVAALAALAIAAVGLAVAILTRSRRFGLWAAAGLLAVPEWTGQAFFNVKDVPAAAGYTLLTVALILALAGGSSGQATLRRRCAIGGMLAAGIFLGAGTRLSLLIPFMLSLLVYAALRLGQGRLGGIRFDRGTDVAVAAGTLAGLGAIAILYPNVATKPLTLLVESAAGSAGYPWEGFTLTAGQLLPQQPPWWYLPVWVGASYPLLLGGLAVLGAFLGIRALEHACGPDWRGSVWGRSDLGLSLVFVQALLLPLGAVITGAVMYNGMRQHLYLVPAVAILAGYGAQRLWRWAGSRGSGGGRAALAAALLSLALLVPMAEQARLFPYNYAYVNPVAGIGGVNDRWETDYWAAGFREAYSRVPANAELRCFLVFDSAPCEDALIDPSESWRGSAVDDRWRHDISSTWLVVRRHGGNSPVAHCERAADVTRRLRGEKVIMAYVLRCDPRVLGGA